MLPRVLGLEKLRPWPLVLSRRWSILGVVPQLSHMQLLLMIAAMIMLELNHLKWIWWTEWKCRGCETANEHCHCGRSKWIMYL
jgi:hypothetical protein